jgi:Ca2+-binding EF-hand superfamily protein
MKKKCSEVIKKNYNDIKSGMQIFEEKKGNLHLISRENFKKVLIQYKVGFLTSDIDIILESLVEYDGDMVKYLDWLNFYNNLNEEKEGLAESTYVSASFERSNSRLSNPKELFRTLNKTLKDNKISVKDAFRIFDKNGDGHISASEFR